MTRHLEAMLVMTGRHDASLWGHARHDRPSASRLLTDALDGVNFTIKVQKKIQTIYSYPILYTLSIAINEARTGEPATMLRYQYSRC